MGEEKRKNGCGEEKKWVRRTEVRVRRRGKMGEEKRKNGWGEEKLYFGATVLNTKTHLV